MVDNPAITDAFLLSLFPGRTLEELDEIDWNRLQRALEVKSMGEIETTFLSYQQGLIEAKAITQRQWELIKEHERILESTE